MTGAAPLLEIRRESYSAGPWRIVDSASGSQAGIEEVFDHPNLGAMKVTNYGFDTKAAAVAALGELAGGWWFNLQAARAEVERLTSRLETAEQLLRDAFDQQSAYVPKRQWWERVSDYLTGLAHG